MIKQKHNRVARVVLTLFAAIFLTVAGLAPFNSLAYSQRRTERRTQINQRSATYVRSYLQGYNEGFSQGQADWSKHVSRDFQRSDQYQHRDRSIEQGHDSSDDLTHSYNLGLELGYSDGYYGRVRNSAIPANARAMVNPASYADAERTGSPQSVNDSWDKWTGSTPQKNYPPLSVADNTQMRLRLTSPINTKTDKTGDRFTAIITSPSSYAGATVEGHIASLNRPERAAGKMELALTFDSIILTDGEQGPFNAELERILLSEEVKKVSEEGHIESGSRIRDSEMRSGVGGAAATGAIYVEGNNDLILGKGTEMVIRTARQKP